MTIRVQVCDSLDAVPAADWDRVAASRSVFQDQAWYHTTSAYGRLQLLVAHRDESLAGLLPLFVVTQPGHYFHTPRDLFCGFRERALLESTGYPVTSLDRAATSDWFPAAVSVSPYGYRGGLIANEQDDGATGVAEAMARAAQDLCRREGVRVAAFYYLNETDDRAWIDALAGQEAQLVIVGADCNLDVKWRSLEEYFRALGPRGRRLKAAHRQARQSGDVRWEALTIRNGDLDVELAQSASALFAQTARKHQDPDPPISLYERLLLKWPGRRILLTGESTQGDLRSCLLALSKGETLYPKLFGARDAKGDYFFLTYSWLLDLAIAQGASRIEYGGGSHQAKLLRGARLRWLLAGVWLFDREHAARMKCCLPYYESAKIAHFSGLAARYQLDHTPPPQPIVEGASKVLST